MEQEEKRRKVGWNRKREGEQQDGIGIEKIKQVGDISGEKQVKIGREDTVRRRYIWRKVGRRYIWRKVGWKTEISSVSGFFN